MNYAQYLDSLKSAVLKLDNWRDSFGKLNQQPNEHQNEIQPILQQLVDKLSKNYPFHHPSYAGQMLKPPHPIAWLAYTIASTINPNNHALDGGPPTSEMEKEVVAKMANMVGFNDSYLGHLSSSGTTANWEALWVMSKLMELGKKIAFSDHAHYTHERLTAVLGIPSIKIPTLADGSWDFDFVKTHFDEIGAVVVTLGTTGRGLIEPLSKIIEYKKDNPNLWIHVDAAYGGFFGLIDELIPKSAEFKSITLADSIVIDPHKHGLQPYGCGSILFKNPQVGLLYKHDSPYTYFSSDELHLGEISLECSRAGAAAAAFWATLELFPLNRNGLGSILKECRNAAVQFSKLVKQSNEFKLIEEPELDIVIYFPTNANSTVQISDLSKKIFQAGMQLPANEGFHVSLFTLPSSVLQYYYPDYIIDSETVTVLRSVFMKPEHTSFVQELMKRIESVVNELKNKS